MPIDVFAEHTECNGRLSRCIQSVYIQLFDKIGNEMIIFRFENTLSVNQNPNDIWLTNVVIKRNGIDNDWNNNIAMDQVIKYLLNEPNEEWSYLLRHDQILEIFELRIWTKTEIESIKIIIRDISGSQYLTDAYFEVSVSECFMGEICGLCGYYDGDKTNDFIRKNPSNDLDFIDSSDIDDYTNENIFNRIIEHISNWQYIGQYVSNFCRNDHIFDFYQDGRCEIVNYVSDISPFSCLPNCSPTKNKCDIPTVTSLDIYGIHLQETCLYDFCKCLGLNALQQYSWNRMTQVIDRDNFVMALRKTHCFDIPNTLCCNPRYCPLESQNLTTCRFNNAIQVPPTTSAPITPAPITVLPTTSAPTTSNPSTSAPTTASPTTGVPTTSAPTSSVPTTPNPTTSAPITSSPTTGAPTTPAPVTSAPTSSPMTAAPSTGPEFCDIDGASSTYIETIENDPTANNGKIRHILASGCPNHRNSCVGKGKCPDNGEVVLEALTQNKDIKIPAYPCIADKTYNVECVGGDIGITLNGVSIFSQYGGDRETCNDAIQDEAYTYDKCGGHSTPYGEYHYHLSPGCLLDQLNDANTININNGHSPQIGWAFDGFPIYGPHGLNGKYIKRCNIDGAIFDDCLDECNGHSHHSIDGFTYHYHVSGPIGDLMSNTLFPVPTKDEYPYSIGCLKGVPFDWDYINRHDNGIKPICSDRNGYINGYIPNEINGITDIYVERVSTTTERPTRRPATKRPTSRRKTKRPSRIRKPQ